jgi:lipopolysaccharide heptosyltransferase I
MADPKLLVLRLGSLGDIVHTFPAVSGLRQSFPNAEIVWLTHPKWETLVRASGLASELWTLDTRDWSSLRAMLSRVRKHGFTAAIDYQGLWKSASIPFLSGISPRIGFSSHTIREAGVQILYTDRVNVTAKVHIADQNGLLSTRLGAKYPVGNIQLAVNPEDESTVCASLRESASGGYIVLSPGGGWRSKCWPAERFGNLAARIAKEFGLRCVINAGPGEADAVQSVLAAADNAQPLPYSGSLGQLMALLKHAKAVVAGDTGPLHLANALGTPVVALFGPTDPARNGPYWPGAAVLRWANAKTSYKRADQPDESLLHISVDEVMQALRGLLGSQNSAPHSKERA